MKNSFNKKVYEITKLIPRGKVATYGQIAGLAGKPKGGRAVGVLMRINPHVPEIPCHRVVSVDGRLTGYSGSGGIKTKKKMLLAEGVIFKDDAVDLARSGWNRN